LQIIPTRDSEKYHVGNTVEVKDGYGVVEVLSERPLSSVDAPMNNGTSSSRFKAEGGNETYDDFGGSEHIVAQVKELEDSLSSNGSFSALGGRPVKGVLFVGPSGTGKTMLARIIASQTGSAFFQVRGPEVISKWVGESEETLCNLFDDAAAAQEGRAIIFFDEIDSIAGRRDALNHDFSRSVVAQLLTLMDGFKPTTNVLVIAATNRPDAIDPALRRPGRFDLEIPFDLPNERDREEILRAAARKQDSSDSLPHAMIAKRTDSWTPAELAGIWHAAVRIASREGRGEVDEEDYLIGYEQVEAQRRQKTSPRSGGQAT
jgi:transitional endoplasmic reticulum ATPase